MRKIDWHILGAIVVAAALGIALALLPSNQAVEVAALEKMDQKIDRILDLCEGALAPAE